MIDSGPERVRLSFEESPAQDQRTRAEYRPNAGASAILWWFYAEVRFEVDDVNLLELKSPDQRPLMSLLLVCIDLRHILGVLATGSAHEWDTGGAVRTVLFAPAGDGLATLTNTHTGRKATVTIAALQAAVSTFVASARVQMLSIVPEAVDDTAWGWWFRDECRRDGRKP